MTFPSRNCYRRRHQFHLILQIFTERPTRVRHEASRFLVRNSGEALAGLSRGLPALARAPAEAGWGPQGAAAAIWGHDT